MIDTSTVPTTDGAFDAWTPCVRSDAVVEPVGDGLVMWSPVSPAPIAVDALGALVTQFFDGSTPMGEIVDDVHEAVQVPRSVARDRLRGVLTQLADAGMLSEATATIPLLEDADYFPAPPNT